MQLFSPNSRQRFIRLVIIACLVPVLVGGGIYYRYFRDVEYSPVQPVAFSHKIHVEKLGMDCMACHTGAQTSAQAGVPDTASCLDCHRLVKMQSPVIEPLLREGGNIPWVRVNRIADHAYFDHRAHVTRGVGCIECHNDVGKMERVSAPQNRGMRWCIDCHKEPAKALRPLSEITNASYDAGAFLKAHPVVDEKGKPVTDQQEFGALLQKKWSIAPKTDCTACHH